MPREQPGHLLAFTVSDSAVHIVPASGIILFYTSFRAQVTESMIAKMEKAYLNGLRTQ